MFNYFQVQALQWLVFMYEMWIIAKVKNEIKIKIYEYFFNDSNLTNIVELYFLLLAVVNSHMFSLLEL